MKKRLIGAMAAVGMAATALTLTANTAQAAQHTCSHVNDPNYSCLAVDAPGDVHSIRVNGRCAAFSPTSGTQYFSRMALRRYYSTIDVRSYGGWHCEGNTEKGYRGGSGNLVNGYQWYTIYATN